MTATLYRSMNRRGEITVFLALVLSILLGLLGVLIESVRSQMIRMNIESVMDASLHFPSLMFRRIRPEAV